MSDCCTRAAGFPNAASMQQMSTNNIVVWEEISNIQHEILLASSQCQPGGAKMCTTISGTTPMTFVTGVDSVEVTASGSGYFTDLPSITFVPPVGSSATGAAATLVTNGGNILQVNVSAGGTGYQPVLSTLSVSSVAGSGAILEPFINESGQIVYVNIVNPGTGYTTADSVIATRAISGNILSINANLIITSVSITGEILAVIVTNPGSGYEPSVTKAKIVSTLNPTVLYPSGTGFMADVLTDINGVITDVVITNNGWGYANIYPYLTISDPGTGATTQVNLSNDSVDTVTVLKHGTNYTQNATGIIYNPTTVSLPNPPTTQARVKINVSNNTFGTDPTLYWQTWYGVVTNKPISMQINSVLSYFKSLGYSISIETNPSTGNTIQWKLAW